MKAQRLPIEWDGFAVKCSDEVEQLRQQTTPIPGRPGWRVDADGREWYSAAWVTA